MLDNPSLLGHGIDAQPHESEATPASEALVLRPLEQGDVFEYTTPVNGWRVQARIVYDANGNRVMSSPGPSRDEAMVFEMRLDNGPWLPIVNPVMGTPLGATGRAQLEENIFKHLGLATTNTAAGAWDRFDQLRGITNQGSLRAVRDHYHAQITREQAQSLLDLVGTYYNTNEREDLEGLLQALVDDAGLHSYIDFDSLEKDQVMQKIVDGVNMQDLEVVRDSQRPEIVTERQDSPAAQSHPPTVD
ncbi:hypothetical protein LTR99_001318 [Exophiala xenobiotica]|uniref:Uncharacterized protein n=1 Tax=Vermiconidia calcicola TaxID=1690605 RepID=A0AAV9QR27_9PEZI|nr:hypothetical protein LTR99_001318 [Exophiala xenobiotica]KAK5437844.1 hypothetical protein LTR34_001391 [Exophiala xenobiotica]KAK5545880.1 hypothetical protein LTR25_000890 [Vermiconidia calcicola]KAK5549860.1 hypothetical protein LTR23_000151 [Chaetothyriales sp. CCFEE 6169]